MTGVQTCALPICEGDMTTPFGGYKLSGFGGRDNSLMAHDQYTEVKTIWIDVSGALS